MPDLTYTKRGVLIDGEHFVSGDYHIGYSDAIDTMTLSEEKEQISQSVEYVLNEYNPTSFIVNGDVFHQFKPPSSEARELIRNMTARIEVENCEFICIEGNHDKSAKSEYPNLLNFQPETIVNSNGQKIVVTHGHKKPESDGDLYILSHLHPIVTINGIKWPTYLYGNETVEESDVLILPAFTNYQDGVTMSSDVRLDIDFPLLSGEQFGSLKPIVYDSNDDETREFPVLSKSTEFFGV